MKPRTDLRETLEKRLGIGGRAVYRRANKIKDELPMTAAEAMYVLAHRNGIDISKYIAGDELDRVRSHIAQLNAGKSQAAPSVSIPRAPVPRKPTSKGSQTRTPPKRRRGTSVFVVHGRNATLRKALFQFLRSVGLDPIEWNKAIKGSGRPSPYVGEILEGAFRDAAAIVVLLTPDDVAKLKDVFVKPSDPAYEKELSGQARPNVLFEAGMAFGFRPENTVLVQIGDVRPFSDIAGRHTLHLSNSAESRHEFVTKLANAGANVNTSGTDWLSEGDFEPEE